MSKLPLRISSEALSDLEKIWVYTLKKWSIAQADRYFNLIMNEIEFLRTHPQTGRSANSIRSGYRVSFVKSHLIYYRIGADGTLEISRILHQGMNLEEWLEK